MAPTTVMIMAKAPDPGQVKTRLCPPLTPGQAAALCRAFLCNKIAQVRTLTSARPAIAYTPASGEGFFADVAPDFTRMAQQGPEEDLARLRTTLSQTADAEPRYTRQFFLERP